MRTSSGSAPLSIGARSGPHSSTARWSRRGSTKRPRTSRFWRPRKPPERDRLFTFTRLDPAQWKAARTTNAIERLNEEFRRRIKTQTVLPCAETVPMLLWALLASGQITTRKVDEWQTLDEPIEPMPLDLAA